MILLLHINFSNRTSNYIDSLPENCENITIADLLIHYSGLAKPTKAYCSEYSIDDFIKLFVSKSKSKTRQHLTKNDMQ